MWLLINAGISEVFVNVPDCTAAVIALSFGAKIVMPLAVAMLCASGKVARMDANCDIPAPSAIDAIVVGGVNVLLMV